MKKDEFNFGRVARGLVRSGTCADLPAAQLLAHRIGRVLRGETELDVPIDWATVAMRLSRQQGIPLRDAQLVVFGAIKKNLPLPVEPRGDDETPEEAEARIDRETRENARRALQEARLMASQMKRDGMKDVEVVVTKITDVLTRNGIPRDVAMACAVAAAESASASPQPRTKAELLPRAVEATIKLRSQLRRAAK